MRSSPLKVFIGKTPSCNLPSMALPAGAAVSNVPLWTTNTEDVSEFVLCAQI